MIGRMKKEDYGKKLEILSGSSVGQHVRHILELYQCLLEGAQTNEVNYDNRKRNLDLESDPVFALNTINEISEKIVDLDGDGCLNMFGSFSIDSEKRIEIKTSVYRELAYNQEHSIHHQALIKIGLSSLGLSYLVDSDFGVAPATIKYQNSRKTESVEAS